MEEPAPGLTKIVMHTAHPERYTSRPPRSARLGCVLLVFFLVLGSGSIVLVWAVAVLAMMVATATDQAAAARAFINQDTLNWFAVGVALILGAAVGLPLAAYSQAEDFLIWLKRRG